MQTHSHYQQKELTEYLTEYSAVLRASLRTWAREPAPLEAGGDSG